jgi:hypothetical protein
MPETSFQTDLRHGRPVALFLFASGMLARMGAHPERGFGVSPQFDPRGDACANLASSSVA